MNFSIPDSIEKNFVLVLIILFRSKYFTIFQVNYFLCLCIPESNLKSPTESIFNFLFRPSFNC